MHSHYEESILRSMRRMTRAIDIYSRRLAKGYELTGPQLICMRHLERTDGCAPKDLSAAVSLSRSTISGILDRLEARDLVTRERSEKDKRRVTVRLTGEGRALVAYAPSPMHEHLAARLAQLPDDEQAALDRALATIVQMMEASDVDAAPMLTAGHVLVEHGDVEEFLTAGDDPPKTSGS